MLAQNLKEAVRHQKSDASATGEMYLSDLSETFLINDRPFDVPIRDTFRVSFPGCLDGTNQRPEFIQFAPHPSHSARSSDLFINFFQCRTQSFLFRSD